MKTNLRAASYRSLVILALALGPVRQASAQGPLTPPGAPAPTMKTLAQVEARTPLPPIGFNPATDFPITISQPGSYYLTQNVTGVSGKHGIVISTGNVTLDLNGFTLQGPGIDGISGASAANVVIRNGRIRNWTERGAYLGTVAVVEDLNVENCGLDGIKLGEQSAVRRCRIGACALPPNSGYGIIVQHLSVVENCSAVGNSSGILITYGCTVRDCSASYSGRWGIRAGYDNVIKSNLCDSNGTAATDGAGIYATDANNRIEDNKLLNADIGLHLDSTGNYVADNVVKNNTKNYDIAPILGKANQLNILLCQIPETIEWPCAVRLAGSLYLGAGTSNGITVAANDVTIDMGGHTLTGPGANSGNGIFQGQTFRNLRVFNGKVVEWKGSFGGIRAEGSDNQIDHVQASSNAHGIYTGVGGSVSDCKANNNSGHGINGYYTSVTNSTARLNGLNGIWADSGSVTNCAAFQNNSTDIHAWDAVVAFCKAGAMDTTGSTVTGNR